MDRLSNVGTVQSALGQFKTAVNNLKNIIGSLNENRASVGNAWESGNASDFIGQYGTLINKLNEAFDGLDAYQQKIDAVVQEIVEFDETI